VSASKPKHASAQAKPSPSAQASATLAATIILNKALKLGIKVAINGDALVMRAPMRLPPSTRRWFEVWLLDNFQDEVVAIIQAENAGGRS